MLKVFFYLVLPKDNVLYGCLCQYPLRVPALNNQFVGASWQACDAVLSIRITLIQIADSDADPAFHPDADLDPDPSF